MTPPRIKPLDKINECISVIKRLESDINKLKKTIENEDWYAIRWEFIDNLQTSQYFFGAIGREDKPYFYIRQRIEGIENEVILTHGQIQELYDDLSRCQRRWPDDTAKEEE